MSTFTPANLVIHENEAGFIAVRKFFRKQTICYWNESPEQQEQAYRYAGLMATNGMRVEVRDSGTGDDDGRFIQVYVYWTRQDIEQYVDYAVECDNEECDPHPIATWVMNRRPQGPLG